MKIPTQEQIQERLTELPEDVRSAITDPNLAKDIFNIASDKKIRIDKVDSLIEYTGYMMLGFIKPKDLADELSLVLDIPMMSAMSLVEVLDDQLFKEIRSSIKMVQINSFDKRFEEAPADNGPLREEDRAVSMDQFSNSKDYSNDSFKSESSVETGDVYSTTQGKTTPIRENQDLQNKINTEPTEIDLSKSFKDKLEERAVKNSAALNADPYKESIE